MVNRILVPMDGSPLAECVLPHVMTFAQTFAANLMLVHVMESGHMGESDEAVDPVRWQMAKNEAQAYLDTLLARLHSHAIEAQSSLLEGRPAECIFDFARDDQTDLIALSSHGHSGLGGWSVGSVAHKILVRARGAKLVVRASTGAQPGGVLLDPLNAATYRRILVPLDGSWRAECVLPLAIKLAQFCEAELVAAHVVRKPEMARRTPPTDEDAHLAAQVEERNRQETSSYFDHLRTRLTHLTETHVLSGESVAASLHELADRTQVDLVILSAHGFTGEMKWPYGSVAQSFIWGSAAPILIFDDSEPCPPMSMSVSEQAPMPTPRPHEVPTHA